MSIPSEASRSLTRKRTENPKTVLAFYATSLGILLAFDLGAIAVFAGTGIAVSLIGPLVFTGIGIFVLLIVGVFVVALVDPSKLMLGQVTGEEYADIQRVMLGDSTSGERIAAIVEVDEIDIIKGQVEPSAQVQMIEEDGF